MASPLARSLAEPGRAQPALFEESWAEWNKAEELNLHQSAPGAEDALDRRTRSPPPLHLEDSFSSLDAAEIMSIEHYAQPEFLYAEERAASPFLAFTSVPPAAATPETAADTGATPSEPATAAPAFQSVQQRPSAVARLVGAGNTGRPSKSQAFPWDDPVVQERLYQLLALCDAGQLTQAAAAATLRREFNNNRVSHSTVSRRFAKMRHALRAP